MSKPKLSPSTNNKPHLQSLVAMSASLPPTLNGSQVPASQAGGGDATTEIQKKQLYLSHDIQANLKRVFDKLRGKQTTLSPEKLVEWMRHSQGQHLTVDGLRKEGYKFEEFLEVIYYNHGFDAMRAPEEKDLSKPISNYYISSSHNTYLDGNQWTSKSSTDAYKNVLLRGCRCIEIDVHNARDETKVPDTPSLPASPKQPDHKRHMSSNTLSVLAAEALEKGGSKLEKLKHKISGGPSTGGIRDLKISDNKSTDSLPNGEAMARTPSARSLRSLRNGEPIVLHGWTLTAPVAFRDVCKTVRENAFVTTNLPIIVSLEVAANLEQQEIMVKIMKEEWAGYLVDEAHPECNPTERLPRLDELLNKILIKVKKAPEKADPAVNNTALVSVPTNVEGDSSSSSSEDEKSPKKKVAKICENLSNLGIYTHSEHFDNSFESTAAKRPSHIFSINESKIGDLYEEKTKREQLFMHNRDFFMRAYPAGFRIDSSNLDPSSCWRKGVQMAALNWQNMDEGLMLNEGMFAGEHGWALKPPGYRSDATEPMDHKTLQLKVTIFGGQHLPLPPDTKVKEFHPLIKCELHAEKPEDRVQTEAIKGTARKSKSGEWKHKIPHGKGDHPDFGHEGVTLEFPLVEGIVEELSFVRFKIEDNNYTADTLAAWACIRLDRLQMGYRFVRLLDAKGSPTQGLLLVKIEKEMR